MNAPIHFYILRNGDFISRTLNYDDALSIVRECQRMACNTPTESHFVIVKGCEQFIPYDGSNAT